MSEYGVVSFENADIGWKKPPICVVGVNGSVKWAESACPTAIMELGAPYNAAILALWYATDGKDRP